MISSTKDVKKKASFEEISAVRMCEGVGEGRMNDQTLEDVGERGAFQTVYNSENSEVVGRERKKHPLIRYLCTYLITICFIVFVIVYREYSSGDPHIVDSVVKVMLNSTFEDSDLNHLHAKLD